MPLAEFQQMLSLLPGWAHMNMQPQSVHPAMQLVLLEIPQQHLYTPEEVANCWSSMPYWAFAWAAGTALATWILEHPAQVSGKRVLDLGCGSGIAGIAAALAGAEVIVVDLDPNAVRAATLNARLNGVTVSTTDNVFGCNADLLLASDLLYDPSSHALLEQLAARIPEALLAEPATAWSRRRQERWPDYFEETGAMIASTLPRIEDFDCDLDIRILHRCRNPVQRMW